MTDSMEMRNIIKLLESADHDMEKVAFGYLKQHYEKDTEWETKVFRAVRNFISTATPQNKAIADAILKDVHALKSKYPNDFQPNAHTAYRGTQLKAPNYKAFLADYSEEKLASMDPHSAIHVADITYNTKSPIQSWTTNEDLAFAFAAAAEGYSGDNWREDQPYPAMLIADVDDTFIMSTTLTNKIAKYNDLDHEDEIIRTSAQPIKCKVYVLVSWLKAYRTKIPPLNR